MKHILLIVCFTCFSLMAFSQTEGAKDTIRISHPRFPVSEWLSPYDGYRGNAYSSTPKRLKTDIFDENQPTRIELDLPPVSFYQGPPLERKETRLPFENDYDYSGNMMLGDGSWISGGGSHQTMLTYGAIRTWSAMYNRQLSRKLTMSAGSTINKYELRNQQYSTADLSGNLNYRINRKMNLNLSGKYSVFRDDDGMGSLLGGYYPENPGEMSHLFRPIGAADLQLDYQVTDWLFVSSGVYSSRYESYKYRFDDYGVNARIGLQVHERVKFNLHGKRSLKGKAQDFGPKGMYPQNSYGGSVEYRFSEKIGVEAGVIREINPWTGKWVSKPYIAPVFYLK